MVDKGNTELTEYLSKKGVPVEQSNIKKADAERLTKAMKKEVDIRQKITNKETVNAPLISQIYGVSCEFRAMHAAGYKGAKAVAPFAAGISLGENLCHYMEGDMELKEALGK